MDSHGLFQTTPLAVEPVALLPFQDSYLSLHQLPIHGESEIHTTHVQSPSGVECQLIFYREHGIWVQDGSVVISVTEQNPIRQLFFATFQQKSSYDVNYWAEYQNVGLYTGKAMRFSVGDESNLHKKSTRDSYKIQNLRIPDQTPVGLCAATDFCLSIYMQNGSEHHIPLPFPLKKAHPLSKGILLEAMDREFVLHDALQRFAYLDDPLSALRAVALREGHSKNADEVLHDGIPDQSETICGVITSESLILTFNSESKRHKVWKLIDQEPLDENKPPLILESCFTDAGPSNPAVDFFLAHDRHELPLLCIVRDSLKKPSTRSLDCLMIVEGGVFTNAFSIEDVICAIPLAGLRLPYADSNIQEILDILVLHKGQNTFHLYVESYPICTIIAAEGNFENIRLCDTLSKRFSMETKQGLFRVTVDLSPKSSLVLSCIQCLHSILAFEDIIEVFRSLLGLELFKTTNAVDEWNLFVKIINEIMAFSDYTTTAYSLPKSTFNDYPSIFDSKIYRVFDMDTSATLDSWGHPEALSTLVSIIKPNILGMFQVFHGLYEDYKLNTLDWKEAESLSGLLCHLAKALYLPEYHNYYCCDFPQHMLLADADFCVEAEDEHQSPIPASPFRLRDELRNIVVSKANSTTVLEHDIFMRSKRIIHLYKVYFLGRQELQHMDWLRINYLTPNSRKYHVLMTLDRRDRYIQLNSSVECHGFTTVVTDLVENETSYDFLLVQQMRRLGIERIDLESMPFGVRLPLYQALLKCKSTANMSHGADVCKFIGRRDLSEQVNESITFESFYMQEEANTNFPTAPGTELDNPACRLRFNTDQRLLDVSKMLQCSRPFNVNPVIYANMESLGAQRKHDILVLYSRRALASCVGRGMYTLGTSRPMNSYFLEAPVIRTAGKLPGQAAVAEVEHPTLGIARTWADFHNGVSVGLRLDTRQSHINRSWTVLQMNDGVQENDSNQNITNPRVTNAGFIFALGLKRRLKLTHQDVLNYLNLQNYAIGIGVLLGIAASTRGILDHETIRTLSLHIPSLRPPNSVGLEVHFLIRTASLFGIGLVYMETNNRKMTEIALGELNYIPRGDKKVERECHSLCAGMALGFINLGNWGRPKTLHGLDLESKLIKLIHGGTAAFHVSYDHQGLSDCPPSILIANTDLIYKDATSPGACYALCMMYLKSNNKSMAKQLAIPNSKFEIQNIGPILYIIRTACAALIMWDSIEPTKAWIEEQIPSIMHRQKDRSMKHSERYIIAGASLALGIRFAGSGSKTLANILLSYAKSANKLAKKRDLSPKDAFMMQTLAAYIACCGALVVAGTGDLEILRFLRGIRSINLPNDTYGYHVLVGMGIGFLFLGGGLCSLSTSNIAVASLLCSMYPYFPTEILDNQYHLQALRHMYVLAVENRSLQLRDADNHTITDCSFKVYLKGKTAGGCTCLDLKSPALLPSYELIDQIVIDDPRYWGLNYTINQLNETPAFAQHNTVFVRIKGIEHLIPQDPFMPKSHFAYHVASATAGISAQGKDSLFGDESQLKLIETYICSNYSPPDERDVLRRIVVDCISKEAFEMIPTFLALVQCSKTAQYPSKVLMLHEFRFLIDLQEQSDWTIDTVSAELLSHFRVEVENQYEMFWYTKAPTQSATWSLESVDWMQLSEKYPTGNSETLTRFGRMAPREKQLWLASFLAFFRIPSPHSLMSVWRRIQQDLFATGIEAVEELARESFILHLALDMGVSVSVAALIVPMVLLADMNENEDDDQVGPIMSS
eukprot:TRINITY_DN11506_c0_g1_i1.p1 TRINITY_DN11506_c0_g1~~TRINITY_DN11506_c0_g1_i1.p1  ORF type:complete len:1753 (-),score=276.58 TRINITY_DN11506_c0_g1_i1:480-5738(-)